MKNCLIGFIVAMALIIPLSSAKAYDNYYNNYSWYNEEYIYNTITGLGYDLEIYPYVATIVNTTMDTPNARIFLFSDDLRFYKKLSGSAGTIQYIASNVIMIDFGRASFTSSSKPPTDPYITTSVLTEFVANIFESGSSYFGGYYANFDIVNNSGTVLQSANLDFTEYLLPPKYDYIELFDFEQEIDYLDARIIEINAKIYDSNYRYEYSIDNEQTWTDITSLLSSEYQFKYNYVARYNQTFTMRVVDSTGKEIDKKSVVVSDLEDFGIYIETSEANDLNGREIIVFDLDFRRCWNSSYKYQYSYDNINFYNIEVDSSFKKYQLNHGIQTAIYFRILDSNNNVIYTKVNNDIFNSIYRQISVKEDYKSGINTNQKTIVVSVLFNQFSQFSDVYNLKYVINGIEFVGSTGSYIYEITRENYSAFKEIQIDVYIDEKLVDSQCYNLQNEIYTFDDKYDNIVEDKLEEVEDNDSYYEVFKKAFSKFSGVVKEIFQNVTYFFNGLPITLQYFYMVVFAIILFIFLIRFIL